MEIVSLFGAMVSYDKGLSKVTKLIYSTLKELGVKVSETNLAYNSVPYYDGIKSEIVEPIVKSIKNADGVIIATTAFSSMYSSIIQTLFEHMTDEQYKDTFKQKNCMLLVVSNEENSLIAMNNLAITLNNLGAYDSTRVLLDHKFIREFSSNPALSEIIERQVEDFYRIIRQKRHYYIPAKDNNIAGVISNNMAGALPSNLVSSLPSNVAPSQPSNVVSSQQNQQNSMLSSQQPSMMDNQQSPMHSSQQNNMLGGQQSSMNPMLSSQQSNMMGSQQNNMAPQQQNNALGSQSSNMTNTIKSSAHPELQGIQNKILPNYSNMNNMSTMAIENFNNKQTEDIKEITQFFSQKHQGLETSARPRAPLPNSDNLLLEPLMPAMPEVTQPKNCRQLTASLVHYYQPQLAGGLVATIQINISGNEEFNGYIQIDNFDCNYYDGIANAPTITIISSDKVWIDVLTGKVTAQKSFMTGNLKIKGNFVLLTKFDQIFNTSKNLV